MQQQIYTDQNGNTMIKPEDIAYVWALLWEDRADDAMEVLKHMLTIGQRDTALLELAIQDEENKGSEEL